MKVGPVFLCALLAAAPAWGARRLRHYPQKIYSKSPTGGAYSAGCSASVVLRNVSDTSQAGTITFSRIRFKSEYCDGSATPSGWTLETGTCGKALLYTPATQTVSFSLAGGDSTSVGFSAGCLWTTQGTAKCDVNGAHGGCIKIGTSLPDAQVAAMASSAVYMDFDVDADVTNDRGAVIATIQSDCLLCGGAQNAPVLNSELNGGRPF